MAIPPFLRGAIDVLTRWHFYAIFLALVLLGTVIQKATPQQQSLVCDQYHKILAPKISAEIDKHFEKAAATQASSRPSPEASTPATAPTASDEQSMKQIAMSAIERFFCPAAALPDPDEGEMLSIARAAGRALPGAAVLGFLIAGLLPVASKRTAIAERVNAVNTLAENKTALLPETTLEELGKIYPVIALTARQLRIAILYAILSALMTFLFHPMFSIAGAKPPTFAQNLPHMLAIAAAAACAAVYGTWGFSLTNIPTSQLAFRLGFGPIFFAGLIAAAISIPYQLLRPPEMFPLDNGQLIFIAIIRLLIMPTIAGVAVAAIRPLFRSMNNAKLI
jgi:hypothetical protein